ncbi:hypothetical protein O7626_40110 [Micromonospora sp. WMMD1102]|uniref:hypothetical protein n=1 Tax=Micromonospora sp. WMMD1102 TaxID=3016105 RepID=UPI0024154C22|nr:hypothetical protein [Micromonospora sp. WMMD1102]MDG4792022.1 hypothetical protein [Micromonospora sp. WMMD1102]
MPIVVTGRHRPHEVVFLAFSAVVGAAFVVGLKPPGSLERLVEPWILWTWYLLLLASGVIGLVSFAIADPYRALVLERAAMIGQISAPAVYGIGLASTGNRSAIFVGAFVAAWAAASGWRLWQVNQSMRALRQAAGDPG